MSFVRSPFVRGLALAILLIGVVACASNRTPSYVYTPSANEDVRERDRASAPAAARPEARAARSPRPAEAIELAQLEPTRITAEQSEMYGIGREPEREQDGFQQSVAQPLAPGYRLQRNDPLIIQMRGIPESDNHELVVDDQGYINLPYIPPIRAEGLTPSELQRSIQDTYVEERIYRRITVNVLLPTQSYFVRGEVRQPGRFPLTAGMTVLKAIAAAGGYTEFANPRRINIIRAGETMIENARQMEQNPEEDLSVKAGDVIIVPRSIF